MKNVSAKGRSQEFDNAESAGAIAWKVPPAVRTGAIIGILMVIVFATFETVRENEFTGFDDRLTLYHNPHLHPAPPETVFHSALWYWSHADPSLYIPVSYEVWAALVPIAHRQTTDPAEIDLNPAVFHTASLGFHMLTVIVVFLLLRRLVVVDWAAALGALAFGLHPLQVESIAWATGLRDILSGLGVMLALWQYVLFAEARQAVFNACRNSGKSADDAVTSMPLDPTLGYARRGAVASKPIRIWLHYALAIFFAVVAMLCKPSAMMLPFIAFTLDWLVIGRSLRRAVISAIPVLLAIAPLIVVTKLTQTGSHIEPVALWQRPFIAADALAFYLYKLFIPIQLAACYARRPALVIQHGWLWWTWIAPAAVAAAIFFSGKYRRWFAAGAGIMLLTLAPLLGLLPFDYQRISTVADHYMYVAVLGPAMVFAFVLTLARPVWPRRICVAAAVSVLLFFAGMSAYQLISWHDPLSLWSHAAAVAPESHTAHINLGKTYDDSGPQSLPLAYVEYARAAELNPNDFNTQYNLAGALVRLGRPDEALDHFKLAMQVQEAGGLDPASPLFRKQIDDRIDLAGVMLSRGRLKDAVDLYEKALQFDPASQRAKEGLRVANERIAKSNR